MRENDTPRIYMACLAAYNAGTLHGCWIDAAQDLDAIWSALRAMLATSPEPGAEEWAIHDFEGFGPLRLEEYDGIEHIHELACFIEEHGELGAALLEHFGGDIEDAERAIENYSGCFESLADYAQDLTEETSQIPQHLAPYIDYEAMGRDMEMGGDVFTIRTAWNETHVFWAH